MGYLDQLVQLQQQSPEKLLQYAERLEEGMKQLALTESSSVSTEQRTIDRIFSISFTKK